MHYFKHIFKVVILKTEKAMKYSNSLKHLEFLTKQYDMCHKNS